MKVEIESRKFVKPSIPTPTNLRDYKPSFFDQLAPQVYPAMLIFYPKNHQIENVEMCNYLEKSLSKTLCDFYPLAGEFSNNEYNCNDHGLEVTRALIHGDLDDVIVKGNLDTTLLDSFVPSLPKSNTTTGLLSVQLSLFSCGGLGLGVRTVHAIFDGASLGMFMNHWAKTNRNERAFVPSFKLSSIFPHRKLVGFKPEPVSHAKAKKLVTKIFLYSSSMISALKQEANGGKVLAVTAHIWRTLIRISQAKNRDQRPSLMSTSVNLRPISSIKLPPWSWGSFVSHPTARFKGGDYNKIVLSELVGLLKNGIAKDNEEFSRARTEDEFFSKLTDQYNKMRGDNEEDVFHVTSWCGFSFYEGVDFGWGKPSWFGSASLLMEYVLLIDTKGGDGVEAWVCLSEEDMEEFRRYFSEDQCRISEATTCSKL